MIYKPDINEYYEYYHRYITLVPDTDIIDFLRLQNETVNNLFKPLIGSYEGFRYEAGKWSIRELLGHLVDTERIFACRALCIARGEVQPLPGYDQDKYVETGEFEMRSLTNILEEFTALRESNIILFSSFREAQLRLIGTANEHKLSAGAAIAIIAGHTEHHLSILRSRYLPAIKEKN